MFRGGDVIDVGANIGYTTTLFARAIDPACRVHAFEPEARNFRWLEHAIARAGLGRRVVAHRSAVGARDGSIELWLNASHHADHRVATDHLRDARTEPTQRVPITAIDAYLAGAGWPPVAFVKIDVQGYEPEVLRGMRETIARTPGLHVAVELMPSALAELGFDPDDFLHDLVTALPHMAILERTGRLRDADVAAIATATERDELGYIDLVCSARP
jgi:FkbM family methyltransferase